MGKAYGDIMNYLSKIGVQPSGTPYVGYFNTDMQDLDIECGLPVAQPVAGTNELKPSEIPAGKQVSCLYTGPYNQIESAYNAIMEWIPANGYTPTGVCYEFYLNNPAETPENELLTRIVFLLK
ncbi:MAG: GyrI-like domain-containing protein [Syntrophomonadaceae bacterium]